MSLLRPLRIATSPTFLRTYIKTAFILIASSILFSAAVLAYTTFYFAYIPVRGISVPVYLQFEHRGTETAGRFGEDRTKAPYGVASRAKAAGKKTICIAGTVPDNPDASMRATFDFIFGTSSPGQLINPTLAYENLKETATQAAKRLFNQS